MLYIDDLLIVGNHVQKIEWIKQLHKKFDMSDLWQMRYYLHKVCAFRKLFMTHEDKLTN